MKLVNNTFAGMEPPNSKTALQFLLEEFIDIAEGPHTGSDRLSEVPPGIKALQERTARLLLPGPQRGFSVQQAELVSMPAASFQRVRQDVGNWLRSLVINPHIPRRRTFKTELTMGLHGKQNSNGLAAPFVEFPAPEDVFWFYFLHLLSRVGLSRIGVCQAPKSQRGQQAVEPEPCGRLYLRRGELKEYCSNLCRARVATQRARNPMKRKTR